MNNLIIIDNTEIKQDSQGRYCLNDLHKASGGESKHRPAYWLSNQQTQELIAEISKDGIPSILIKQGLGTFVSRELVYAYAMWVSPKFHLLVLRTFDKVVKGELQPIPQSLPEALRYATDLAEQKQVLELENKQKSEQIESMESYFRNGLTPPQFAKGLNGVNSAKINDFLLHKNWIYKDRYGWRVVSYARDKYLTEETTEVSQRGKDPFISYKPVLLKKGAAKLYEWYTQSKLPMKTNWNGEFTQDKAVGL